MESIPEKKARGTQPTIRVSYYLIIFAIVWSLAAVASLLWGFHRVQTTAFDSAVIQARTAFEKDVVYRRWNAEHGGVYVLITAQTPPNPYLKTREREITTPGGQRLTKINPAYMTRQVHEIGALDSGIFSHITSLNPIRPQNAPDAWETGALERLEDGLTGEVAEIQDISGRKYMRFMRPLITEKGCLICHQEQGYEVGDIRGGISVAVPWLPFLTVVRQNEIILTLSHLILWLLGMALLIFFNHNLKRHLAERKRIEEALKESENRYRTTFESMPDGITVSRVKDGRYSYVNKGFCQLTGYACVEVIGKTSLEIGLYEKAEDRKRMTRALEEKDELVNYELKFKKKNGELLDILLSARNIEIGNEKCLVALTKDVTDIKRSEEEKARLKSQLRQAQKMEAIGRLAGGIAHDFNNILGVIIGYCDLSLLKAQKSGPADSNYEKILGAAIRAKDLVQQILTFSRREKPQLAPVRLKAVIAESYKFLRAFLPTTIDIQVDLDAGREMILADPTQLHQVLMNLSTNAADAMQDNGGVLSVGLSTLTVGPAGDPEYPGLGPGGYQLLTVRDTGHGMDPMTLERIFEPFFTTKGKRKGTGMGLAVVHGIVASHGGVIKADSIPGRGTSFKVIFPVFKGDPEGAIDAEQALPRGNEHILLVDDEELLADLGTQMLTQLGYRVTAQTNPVEALNIFRERPESFDLVLTDMTMPYMTGANLAESIMALRPDIPVILYTGYSESMTAEQAREIGVAEFLFKPLALNTLARAIRLALDRD